MKEKLPRWCGERPGKRPGDPDTPEGEEEIAKVDDLEGEEVIKDLAQKQEVEEEDLEEEEVEVDEEEEDDDDEDEE